MDAIKRLLILGIMLAILSIARISAPDEVSVEVYVNTVSSGRSGSYVSDPYRPLPHYENRPVYVPYWVQRSGDCLTRRDYYRDEVHYDE